MNKISTFPWNKKLAWGGTGILGLSFFIWAVFIQQSEIPVERSSVTRGEFSMSINADGLTRVKERYVVSSLVSGRVQRLAFHPGDAVKKGQILTKILWDSSRNLWDMKSPEEGTILRVYLESESEIAAGTPLFEIANLGEMEVVANVLSTEAPKIKTGQPVRIKNWGGTDILQGVVRLVEKSAVTKISALGIEEQRVNVIIDFLTPYEQRSSLGDQFKVEAEILISQHKNAIQVPISALYRHENGWAVYKIQNEHAKMTPVVLGGQNDEMALVSEGLKEGEAVILYPPETLSDGAKIKLLL